MNTSKSDYNLLHFEPLNGSHEPETLEETVNNEEEIKASKHDKAAVFKKKKIFSCEECGKTYESDRGLRGHKQKHRMLNSQTVPVVSTGLGVVSAGPEVVSAGPGIVSAGNGVVSTGVVSIGPGEVSTGPGVVSTAQVQEDSNVEYLTEEVNYVIENGVEGVDYDTVEIIVQ